jgi:hypothetical protein
MELIHVFTTPLIEELERQGWTWDGNTIQIEANKLVVALGVKTDKPIFVDVRFNDETQLFDILTQETTDGGAVITDHDEKLSIESVVETIVELQKTQGLDTDAIIKLMIEEAKD